jgi:hypothetical protein
MRNPKVPPHSGALRVLHYLMMFTVSTTVFPVPTAPLVAVTVIVKEPEAAQPSKRRFSAAGIPEVPRQTPKLNNGSGTKQKGRSDFSDRPFLI